jgi:hypothetical protein
MGRSLDYLLNYTLDSRSQTVPAERDLDADMIYTDSKQATARSQVLIVLCRNFPYGHPLWPSHGRKECMDGR